MSKISWRQVSALALAAFFVVGSLSNIFALGSIYEEYLRWGYPHWFHFVTGSLELTTAVLLAQARTRLWGSALGCTVMLAALATVTLHGEYGHGVPPLIVATLSIVVGWIAWVTCLFSTRREEPSGSNFPRAAGGSAAMLVA
ncbi:MAG: DoxX family protein [Rhodomicrobium sp.]